jgi:hypothetical protein
VVPLRGRGLTVNAIHIYGPGTNVVLASSTSDIHDCTAPPPAAEPAAKKAL